MFAPHRSQAQAYSAVQMETGVQGANPHRLIDLLLEGALSAIAAAAGAIERGDMAAKGRAISRAVGIVDEGLRGTLDLKAGGQVAATLNDLYQCVLLRLTQANLHSDPVALRECSALLTPLRNAWRDIEPQWLAQ
jgi:flagellar secretion chaperone FliS